MRGGMGELIRGADDISVEGEARVEPGGGVFEEGVGRGNDGDGGGCTAEPPPDEAEAARAMG